MSGLSIFSPVGIFLIKKTVETSFFIKLCGQFADEVNTCPETGCFFYFSAAFSNPG